MKKSADCKFASRFSHHLFLSAVLQQWNDRSLWCEKNEERRIHIPNGLLSFMLAIIYILYRIVQLWNILFVKKKLKLILFIDLSFS